MGPSLRSRLTFANVAAALALFFALGGASLADPIANGAASLGKRVNRALTVGKKASKTAKSARRTAVNADKTAGEALGTAKQALANDAKLLPSGGKAADADRLDGSDSSAFFPKATNLGGALTGTLPAPGLASGAVGTSAFATLPAVRAERFTTQSLTSGTEAPLQLNTEDYDTANMHSTSSNTETFTAPVGGLYAVSAGASFSAGDTDGSRGISIGPGGSTGAAATLVRANTSSTPTPTVISASDVVDLSASQTVEVTVVQDSGSTLSVGPNNTYVVVHWVGPRPGPQ